MKFLSLVLALSLVTSCGNSIMRDGKQIECYGLVTELTSKPRKVEGVRYELETGNVVWSVLAVGTVVIPIWLMGWRLECPVEGQ